MKKDNKITKKFEMQLLNSEETREIKGGGTCNKAGDTIVCAPFYKLVACRNFVGQCIAPFSSSCNTSEVTIICPTRFTVS